MVMFFENRNYFIELATSKRVADHLLVVQIHIVSIIPHKN